jgi:hypothetical protein
MTTDESITAEVARLRAEKASLVAAQEVADLAQAKAELKAEGDRTRAATEAEADRKAIELVHERTALAVEVEALRARRATALAADTVAKAADLKIEVASVAADVESARQDRAQEIGATVHSEAMDLAQVAATAAAASHAHTMEQDRRLDGINGSQAKTAALLVIVQENLVKIQTGIDQAAAITKALSEKGVTSRQLQMGIAALMIPILILIVSLLAKG